MKPGPKNLGNLAQEVCRVTSADLGRSVDALNPGFQQLPRNPWKSTQGMTGWWLTYPSEKYESQLGWLFSIYGKIKKMFQTTNQMNIMNQQLPNSEDLETASTAKKNHLSRPLCHCLDLKTQGDHGELVVTISISGLIMLDLCFKIFKIFKNWSKFFNWSS